ncbi:MAG: sigma 54-interacting transcriptional regulator [Spirochaetes bacterium]|jgi:PAS domain S-box-containing protein|nr:sigma 54-interacting transcriptional regulator [Spirochaetota bacterium]
MKLPEGIPAEILLDSIADGLFCIDTNFKITMINRSALQILDISRDDAVGKRCYEVFHASVCETACVLRESMDTGTPIVNRDIYVVKADGTRIPLSVSTSVIKDETGMIVAAVEIFRDMSTVEKLRKAVTENYTFEDIISKNRQMHSLFEILPDIAESESTVLIAGESGTGKELFARALHNRSFRSENKFVALHAAALPEQLLESELFGYVKGAFTGANRDKPGRIAEAEGGTLFLDEIGDLPISIQVKLLRFLQFKDYEPIGSNVTRRADVRILAATNKDLAAGIANKEFREDLFYRIAVIRIDIPPLRARREDIPLLAESILSRLQVIRGKGSKYLPGEVTARLMVYNYPGNVRELENIIEYAYVMSRSDRIETGDLPSNILSEIDDDSLRLDDVEQRHIHKVLLANNGNRTETARQLGINPSTLWRKLKDLSLE